MRILNTDTSTINPLIKVGVGVLLARLILPKMMPTGVVVVLAAAAYVATLDDDDDVINATFTEVKK